MILAQLSDPHIVAEGKLFRCPMQGAAPDAERARFEFDTAISGARGRKSKRAGAKARCHRRDRRSRRSRRA
jgi:hypothetical protein